jgi:arginase
MYRLYTSPHSEGLTLSEGAELPGALLRDNRVRIVEISEYASLRDPGQTSVHKLIARVAGSHPPKLTTTTQRD